MGKKPNNTTQKNVVTGILQEKLPAISSKPLEAKKSLRDCMLECIISTISRSFVLVIKHPGSSLEQALKLLILSVLQDFSNVAKDAVNLQHRSGKNPKPNTESKQKFLLGRVKTTQQ